MKISKGTITLAINVLRTIHRALYLERRENRNRENYADYCSYCYDLIDKTIDMLEEWKERSFY